MEDIFSREQITLLEDYMKIMLNIIGDCNITTNMSIPQEEKRREEFNKFIYGCTGTQIVDTAKGVVNLANLYISNHPDQGRLTMHILASTIGLRYSVKYSINYPARSLDHNEAVNLSPQEEKFLTELLTSVKYLPVPESGIVDLELSINKLIQQFTGVSGLDQASKDRIDATYRKYNPNYVSDRKS